jgi:hypothetical protein
MRVVFHGFTPLVSFVKINLYNWKQF